MDIERRHLEARVDALELMLGQAFDLLHRAAGRDRDDARAFNDVVLDCMSKVSVGGVDAADADVRTAEFMWALERLLRGFEEMTAPPAVAGVEQ